MGLPESALAQAVAKIRRGLAGGADGPALELHVHDFTTYHLAMAGLGAGVTADLVISALLWRRRALMSTEPQRGRHLLTMAIVAHPAPGSSRLL